ncbi:hypothetical protein HJC23_005901 [Cyclotella cryptica]|uniref:ShKT domain-containing protein n=1 Tax=Cyclotella cryptica TaxID=29204 RepID=A0ABD3QZZ3_9STRA|eukprot:CCRYP_000447-RA/>CCRYP_000447-RA protein AED:0.03 eAED:0.03 QI:144/1/1/1/0.66/0.5/4/2710/550
MKRFVEILSLLLHIICLTLAISQEGQCSSSEPSTCTSPTSSENTEASGLPPDFVDPCQDQNPDCHGWSLEGGCRARPEFMKMTCPLSCGICKPIKTTASINDAKGGGDNEGGNDLCADQEEDCSEFAAAGECLINPDYMLEYCKYSCWACVNPEKDRALGVEEDIIAKKLRFADMSLGRHQLIRAVNVDDREESIMTSHHHQKVRDTIHEMENYAKYVITSPNIHVKARERCRNEFRMCAEWASRGYCFPAGHPLQNFTVPDFEDVSAGLSHGGGRSKDVLFMMNMCPLACQTCEHVPSLACAGKRHPYAKPLLEITGGLNAYFESLRKDNADQKVLFVSYPDANKQGSEDDSYVVVLPNLLSDEEVDALTNLGKAIGFSSSNLAACRGNKECTAYRIEADATYSQIMERIATITNTSVDHLEPMEIIRYNATSLVSDQSDSGLRHNYEFSGVWKPAGPRVLSLLLFLSDHDEKDQLGFPYLDWLFVHPKKGTAVLWPNVINENAWEMDPLTTYEHFGIRGEGTENVDGFVANVHVRLYNWTDADFRGCA